MQRRSFFGVLFGGLLATRWRRSPALVVVVDPVPYQVLPPGMAGAYHPMVGGRYAPDQPMAQFTDELPVWVRDAAD